MKQPNDKGVTLTPATSTESRMYDAILRAEAAEQERDKLIGNINLAIGVLNMMQSGRFDKQTVIDMLERIIKEGRKPDATE